MKGGSASGTATVLFTDLVGSTELMTRMGDLAYDALRSEHFASLREVTVAHGGVEVKNTGDGVMATFGSAVEALAAAVAMQQAAERQGGLAGAPLAIRVGLSLGEVTLESEDVFGTPVVEAARLVAAARPGQILATAVVRVVAGSRAPTTMTDVGALDLKGLPDPVMAYEVSWESAAVAVPLPPLLTGVGKTRLAGELAHALHDEGALVLAGRCDEDLGVPYQPFVEALRHYVSHTADPRLGRHAGELARLVPELTQLVPALPEPLRSDPETERYRLFDAVAVWLANVSAETSVLLVLDDLQWAAKPTLLLLRHVLRSSEPVRLLVVATYRDTDIGRGHPLTEFLADLRREAAAQRVSLTGLDQAAVAAFIEAAAGRLVTDEEDQAFIRAVWSETEGNPFFVAEVVRHLS
ncbi:MAG: adenylate/guanylate cyclase domain-containing protein, partial [Actinomycetota bacterium]|nr:adenylate/guanylate cyclase domain-containing protein [Actinomycetota bacterium]